MAGRKVAAADPARSIGLLWSAGKAGRTGLSATTIVEAAIAVADADGLGAVSMRRVAERLGVGAMSLYTHVPSRPDLLDLMTDTALAGLYTDVDEPARADGGWRGGLRLVAERNWGLYRRHPWLLDVAGARPVLGPHTARKYEAELRPLDGIGITDVEMDSVLTLVLTHVAGTARQLHGVARTRAETGMTDAEWWQVVAPVLARHIDSAGFPVSGRVGQASSAQYDAASDPAHAYAFGLDRILDGVEQLVRRRAAG